MLGRKGFIVINTVILIVVLVIGILIGDGIKTGNNQTIYTELPEENKVIYESELVNSIEEIDTVMLQASYWTNQCENKLLYSEEEISKINTNNPSYVLYKNEVGYERRLYQDQIDETLDGHIVRELLDTELIKSFSKNEKQYYINEYTVDDDYWEQLEINRNIESVKDTVKIQFAISTKRTVAMIVPSNDFATNDVEEKYCNDFVSAEIMPFTGVVILHESKDKNWYFVLCGSYCGWISTNDVAVCKDQEEWSKALNPEEFLVVTGNQIVLDENINHSSTSAMILPMGVKLELETNKIEKVNGRSTIGCYVVKLPVRDDKGNLDWELVTIPVSKDVHKGYMTMMSYSVITQAFKFLGQVYGWGGSLSSNDCSGYVRQVYACFGLNLPRNSLGISSMKDLGGYNCTKMTTAKKLSVLKQMPAGLPLYMDGHLMLYLGMEQNIPYVISSCASYIPQNSEDTSSSSVEKAYCFFVSNMELLRRNGNTWLEDMSYFVWKEY